MSREPKKSPGQAAASRRKHLARQRVYDAIKFIDGLPDGEQATISLHGRTFRVVRENALDVGEWGIYLHRGRIGFGHSMKLSGEMLSETSYRSVWPDRIIAQIVAVQRDLDGDGTWHLPHLDPSGPPANGLAQR